MIRPTSNSDFESIIQLATVSGLFEPEQAASLAAMLQSPAEDDVWFTDAEDGHAVAVAFLAPEKMTHGTWNLYWIAVDPAHQRTGRGTAMLKFVEDWLIKKGARLLLVETAGVDDFEYVRNFYRLNGFHSEARIRDFYDAGVDKVVFRKVLIGAPR